LIGLKHILISAVVACAATMGNAATVVSVDSPSPDGFGVSSTLSPDVLGIGFNISDNLENASISAEFVCAVAGCSAQAFLVNEVGPTAGLANIVASATLDGSTQTVFSGLDLVADNYALVLSATSGSLFWSTATSPTVSGDGRGAPLNSFTASAPNINPVLPFASNFIGLNASFLYSISANDPVVDPDPPVNAVPIGPTAPLAASGLILLLGFRRLRA